MGSTAGFFFTFVLIYMVLHNYTIFLMDMYPLRIRIYIFYRETFKSFRRKFSIENG